MLKDKVVVITGASSGIGAEIAILLAKHGAIPILMARSMDKLQEVALRINDKHDLFPLDVTSTEQVFQVMDQVISKYGKIDILINNAGFGVFAPFINAKLEDYENMIDVNYLGMARCTKAVLPYMLQNNNGHIINIASVAGKIGTVKAVGYAASKFAAVGFSKSLALELLETDIQVSTINTGPVDTPFFDQADPSGSYVKKIKWFMLSPEKVARQVIKVIKNKKTEVTMPFLARIGVKIYCLFPKIFISLFGSRINQK